MARDHRPQPLRLLGLATGTLVLGATGAVGWYGFGYYSAPIGERVYGHAHRIFGSAGSVGLGCGIAATVLFIANLLYVPRRESAARSSPRTLPAWLDWHVLTGVMGTLLIPLHAAFELRSTIAKTAVWALAIVIVTGLVGRYMVRFIPRTRSGEQLGLDALQERLMSFIEQIRSVVQHDAEAVQVLQRVAEAGDSHRRPAVTIGENVRRLRGVRRDIKRLRRAASGGATVEVALLIEQMGKLYRQAALVEYVSQFMDSWRMFHRVLSLLFVVAVAAHVGIALWAGQVRF